MSPEMKKLVFEANFSLKKHELVLMTWGNVSVYDPSLGQVVIKPSGVAYETMKPDDMVVLDLDGNILEGALKPSSDTLTHLEIYKHFKDVRAIVHTHSKWATIFCQSKLDIPIFGTTHADYFSQPIPLTRDMKAEEIETDYEKNTGKVIVETFQSRNISPTECPAVLVSEHGPFVWGKTVKEAIEHAIVLETIAEMAYHTMCLRKEKNGFNQALLKKHYERKHGQTAYYGQKK